MDSSQQGQGQSNRQQAMIYICGGKKNECYKHVHKLTFWHENLVICSQVYYYFGIVFCVVIYIIKTDVSVHTGTETSVFIKRERL